MQADTRISSYRQYAVRLCTVCRAKERSPRERTGFVLVNMTYRADIQQMCFCTLFSAGFHCKDVLACCGWVGGWVM